MPVHKNLASMSALQWDGYSIQLNQINLPELLADSALIKVSKAGICNTDLEIIRGYYPFQGTLGHEFVGIVDSVGTDGNSDLIGQRVVCDINCACQSCSMCLAGHPHHCLKRNTIGINNKDGAFAQFLCAPVANLVLVPDQVSDDKAVFAEPLAAALEIIEQVDFTDIDEVAVIGDGKLGLLISMALASYGLAVNLIGHHPEKLALVAELGVKGLNQLPDNKFAVVIEASGNPQGFNDAIKITQAKGTLVLKSTYAGKFDFNPAPLVVNEITLIGSRCGPMDKAINLMEKGSIKPECLIEENFTLKQGVQAIQKAQQKGTLKVIINLP